MPVLTTTEKAQYDDHVARLGSAPVHVTVNAVVPANLAGYTYDNGTAGVGATLTAGGNGAFATQDGVAAALNNIYLLPYQTTGAQRGVYRLTTLGDGSTAAVLTRMTVLDTASKLADCVVRVRAGTLFKGTEWHLDLAASDITVGTTALAFTEPDVTPLGHWSNANLSTGTGAFFMSQEPNTITAASTTERGDLLVYGPCVLTGLISHLGTAYATANHTQVVMLDGVATALTTTISATQTDAQDVAVGHHVAVSAGPHRVTVQATNDASDNSQTRPKATVLFRPLAP